MDSQYPSITGSAQSEQPKVDQQGAPFEPFYGDWRQTAGPASGGASLVLSNRQLAIIGFLLTAAMTLMSALSYVAGRATSTGAGSVLMVESAQPAVATAAPVAKPEAKPMPLPADLPVEEKIIAQASPVPRRVATLPVTTGDSYWQVGALEEGMAEVSRRYLEDNALPVRLESIAGTKQLRVMVGPAAGDQVETMRARLEALGFQPFLKRF